MESWTLEELIAVQKVKTLLHRKALAAGHAVGPQAKEHFEVLAEAATALTRVEELAPTLPLRRWSA